MLPATLCSSLLPLALDLSGRRGFQISAPQITVGLISALVMLVCVLFHYEVMSWSSRLVHRLGLVRRAHIVVLLLIMLVAHVIEVWIFGLTFYFLDRWPQFGQLEGGVSEGAFDFIYFSATSYTTLGFGDIVPTGPIRILCGTEALIGLSLITWSASLGFLQMQHEWTEYREANE